MQSISLKQAARYWLKLGCVSFGGPAGQIALMQSELVEHKGWISQARFNHALNYCMLLPGPEAQQLATYLGWLMHGWKGGLLAGLCFILPSLVLMIGLAWLYLRLANAPQLEAMLQILQPVTFAIVLFAAWRMALRSLTHWLYWCFAGMAFVLSYVWQLPFPYLVLVAGALGYLLKRVLPQTTSAHASDAHAVVQASSPLKLAVKLAVNVAGVLALWALPLLLLRWQFGHSHVYVSMAEFFTKVALVTFGGAYAVLPYIYQGAVVQFGWLTQVQMLAGLALGETTPGPLIMIVAFVGYLASAGPMQSFAFGAFGAVIVCWFTFLPSFAFILIGAPWVERTRAMPHLHTALGAIGAVVVASIALLAANLFMPTFYRGTWQVAGLIITLISLIALSVLKRSVIEVVLAALAIGLLRAYF